MDQTVRTGTVKVIKNARGDRAGYAILALDGGDPSHVYCPRENAPIAIARGTRLAFHLTSGPRGLQVADGAQIITHRRST